MADDTVFGRKLPLRAPIAHLLFLCLPVALAVAGQIQPRIDFDKTILAIRATRATKDLQSLIPIAEETRRALPRSSYGLLRIMREICDALSSVQFNDQTQSQILQDLAIKTVREADDGPLDQVVPIVQHVQIDIAFRKGLARGADWERSRRGNTRLYLYVLRRLLKEVDRNFNFRDLPQVNIAPPGGKYKSGISPDSIKEPEIRAIYEKALRENAEKARKYNHQRTLHELEKGFLRTFELNVVRAYSIEPVSVEEVKADFNEFGVWPELTKRVVTQLEARIAVTKRLQDKLKQTAEKVAVSPRAIPIGTPVDAKALSSDPRLQVPISFTTTRPTMENILETLTSFTRLQITLASSIPKDRLAFWSISYHGVPAWSVMDDLCQAVTEKGYWVKQDNGYQLIGNLKPPLESLLKDSNEPRGPLLGYLVLGIAVLLLALSAFLLTRYWRRKQAPKIPAQPS